MRGAAQWARDPLDRAWARVVASAWPLLQQTAAAIVAWIIAERIHHHGSPFFAPISAVVALNATRGERGVNTLQLLAGVLVGIIAGELALDVLNGADQSIVMAVAMFAAMVASRAFSGTRIVVAQAAAAAILTVAVARGQGAPNRIADALVGAGVALVFSQLLFTPEPVALLRRAESAILDALGKGLVMTSEALADQDRMSDGAITKLSSLGDHLADLNRMMLASTSVRRYSVLYRLRGPPEALASENPERLSLLSGSCLVLARTLMATDRDEHRTLVPVVREVGGALRAMADDPGDREVRRHAAERIRTLAAEVAASGLESRASGRDAVSAMRLVVTDVLVFAGTAPDRAEEEARRSTTDPGS